MEIIYLGHSSFKIKGKTGSVVCDPFDPGMVGLKYSKIDADIVTISHDHNDHNQAQLVSGVKKIIDGPGEYEILGISIIGFSSFHDDNNGAKRGKNTIYVFEIDGLRLAHLGDLGHTLSEKLQEQIGDIDILMIPVGGEYTIGPKDAVKIIQDMEPHFIIPMHYQVQELSSELSGKLLPLDDFLKEAGLISETLPKFQIKKEDILPDQNSKIIILEKC